MPRGNLRPNRDPFQGMHLSASQDMRPIRMAIQALSSISGNGIDAKVSSDGVQLALSALSKQWNYANQVQVRNVGSDDLNPYEPAQIVGTPYDTVTDRVNRETYMVSGPVIDVRRPQSGDDLGRFVVMSEYVPAATTSVYQGGQAWSAGIVPMWAVNTAGPGAPSALDINPTGLGAVTLPPYPLDNVTDGSVRVIYAPSTLHTEQRLALCQFGFGAGGGGTTDPDFWARIDSATIQNGSGTGHPTDPTTQWIYAWSEMEKTGSGYGGFTVLSGGRNSTTDGAGYNTFEIVNTTITAAAPNQVMGNGVTLAGLDYDADLTYEFYPRPITTNTIVRMRAVPIVGTSNLEYWFEDPNGIDGGC